MRFGTFSYNQARPWVAERQAFEELLAQIELTERVGFDEAWFAEHHHSDYGMLSSPNLIIASLARRTARLRMGNLVSVLPLYDPMRLAEECSILDILTNGRLNVGLGRGVPKDDIKHRLDRETAQARFEEGIEILERAWTGETFTYSGKAWSYQDISCRPQPLQKPHPPMWYGVHSVQAAERAAKQSLNMVSLDSAKDTRSYNDKYRQVWSALHGTKPTPKLGVSRFIVIADSDQEALTIARRAYPVWHRSFYFLFSLRGGKPAHPRPAEFDKMMGIRQAIAGDPETAREFLQAQLAESGANYLVGQFAFGDLSLAESLRSVQLFSKHVMAKLTATT